MAVQVRLVDRVSTHRSRICQGCRSSANAPFVRTNIQDGGFGPIHLCSKCATVIGEAVGLGDVQAVRDQYEKVVAEFADKIRQLDAELEQTRDNLVVPLAEVIDLVAERERRRPVETVA